MTGMIFVYSLVELRRAGLTEADFKLVYRNASRMKLDGITYLTAYWDNEKPLYRVGDTERTAEWIALRLRVEDVDCESVELWSNNPPEDEH
jgi:hypothetical protein